jgi:hypothetical protein
MTKVVYLQVYKSGGKDRQLFGPFPNSREARSLLSSKGYAHWASPAEGCGEMWILNCPPAANEKRPTTWVAEIKIVDLVDPGCIPVSA